MQYFIQELGEILKYTEGNYHSIYGKIGVRWETDGNQITLTVEIPVNTTAEIRLDQARMLRKMMDLCLRQQRIICMQRLEVVFTR